MNRNSTAATTAALAKLLEAARRELTSMHPDRRPSETQEISPVAIAKSFAHARLQCSTIFDDRLASGPAWYLMLHLYVAADEGRTVVSSAVGEALGVPYTTAYRWLQVLESQGHIITTRHDGRTNHVSLTPEAHARMTEVLQITAIALAAAV